MKKIVAALLAVFIGLTCSSCKETEAPPEPVPSTAETPTTDPWADIASSSYGSTVKIDSWDIPITDPWVMTKSFQDGWRYEDLLLEDAAYCLSIDTDRDNDDFADTAKRLGYQAGSYEYVYFYALFGLSYYASIAHHRIQFDYLKDENLVDSFFENEMNPSTFQKPYEDILYECFTILNENDIGMYYTDHEAYEYGVGTADYRYNIVEWTSRLALFFSDIDTKLVEYAEMLLSVSEAYPDYTGEFKLSETSLMAAQHLIEACEPVAKEREALFESWRLFYQKREPRPKVVYRYLAAQTTVKVTVSLEDHIFSFAENPDWIKGSTGDVNTFYVSPMTLYLPIRYYYETGGQIPIIARDMRDNIYDLQLTLPVASADLYSTEEMTLSEPFLDAVMKREFGGSYSCQDLSKIKKLDIRYRSSGNTYDVEHPHFQEPIITVTFYELTDAGVNRTAVYRYSDFFEERAPIVVPKELKEDIKAFPCLQDIWLSGNHISHLKIFLDRDAYMALKAGFIKEYTAKAFE